LEVVRELLSADGRRKVKIFRRVNGTFGFSVWHFSDEPLEMAWIPAGYYSESFTPDAESAEREARSRVAWLDDPNASA
jgi:hypothetical protein